jgi:hypothetical protein
MWQELGIPPSRDLRAIKLAYAARLKQVHPEDDPEGFQRLRAAYEWALKQAQRPAAAAKVQVVVRPAPPPQDAAPQVNVEFSPPPPPAPPPVVEPVAAPVPEIVPEPSPKPAPPPPAIPPLNPLLPPPPAPPHLQPQQPPPPAAPKLQPQQPPPPAAPQLQPPQPPPPASPHLRPQQAPPPSAPQLKPLQPPPPAAPRLKPLQARPPAAPRLQPPPATTARPPQFPPPPPAAAAAASLIELLLRTAVAEQPAALQQALRSRGWEHLDFQAALERALIARLGVDFERCLPLIDVVARQYGWQAGRRQVQYHQPAATLLLDRHAARQRRLALEAAQPRAGKLKQQAALLLFHPVDEAAFRRFARRSRQLQAMRSLLGELQGSEQALRRHEVNAAAFQWWTQHLQSDPLSWDRLAALLGWGVLCGPLLALVLLGIAEAVGNFDLSKHQNALLVVLGLSALVPLAGEALRRGWRRMGLSARVSAVRQRWRQEPRRRGAIATLTGLVILLNAGAGNVPGFWLFAPAAALLLWFWTSLPQMLACALVFAWPLQIPLSLLVDAAFAQWPRLLHGLDPSPLTIWWPHVLAMYLVLPLLRLWRAFYRKLFGRLPVLHGRQRARLLFASFCLLMVALGILSPDHSPPVPTPAPNMTTPLRRPPTPAVASAPPATPMVTPPLRQPPAEQPPAVAPPRSDAELHQAYLPYQRRFDALFLSYFRAHPGQHPGWVRLQLSLAPSGAVDSCRLLDSSYHDAAFEQKLIDLAKTQTFEARPGAPMQNIVIGWGKPPTPAAPTAGR